MQRPKLKDNQGEKSFELYPLGNIPNTYILEIGKWMAYYFAFGRADINGEDWGDIFAKAINGDHLSSPLGLADVVLDGMAWSVKSIKQKYPHSCKKVRVISGRCSPDYSYGISDPHDDIEKTGKAVLNIWNERVNIAKNKFEPLRISILIRNPITLSFSLFEYEAIRYDTNTFIWKTNKNGNLEGFDSVSGEHRFTWQPHGAQFTVLYDVPLSVKNFSIKRPPILSFKQTLEQIGFDESWITIL